MKRSIKHQFSFSHPPEKVWDYLTKPELMATKLKRLEDLFNKKLPSKK